MKLDVKKSTVVRPAAETPRVSLWNSNLDLVMPNFHVPIIYFYRRPTAAADFFDAAVLTAALARVMVPFYPVAGRLKKDVNGRFEIDCNAEGALFVEAESDGRLDDFGEYFSPTSELRCLVPAVDYSLDISAYPLLVLQVTHFKCGGVSLGVGIQHHVVDGLSGIHFMNTWSDMARGHGAPALPPSIDRNILRARNPPRSEFEHIEYHYPPTPASSDEDRSTTTAVSVLKLSNNQLNSLKSKFKSPDGNSSYTSYEMVAAHIWRCATTARRLAPEQETKVYIATDGRSRLLPPPPPGYFGNVVFTAAPVAASGDIRAQPVGYAAGKIRDALARMDDEYMRSALDYLELQDDVKALVRGPHTFRCPNMGITSWVRMPAYVADFGWGGPVYVGPGMVAYEGLCYLLPPPRSANKDGGGLLVVISLQKEHMEVFEELIYDI
ncbi:hypothetical protein ABFX02_09G081700 [Erythranthe guttata]